ncbi:hypothetical protein [Streptosporangium amethystogenes]|uniref:hypothetical protein n=1 Tax=Streptosporangium amethystogenes TaxID=2002 RepID=UPI00056105CB|nr:hypothetical protein [Streptosporangium amethystogenes]
MTYEHDALSRAAYTGPLSGGTAMAGLSRLADRLPATTRHAVPALVRAEARLLLRHPLNLLGFALMTALFLSHTWEWPQDSFRMITAQMVMEWGVLIFFAANLVGTAARRAGTQELLSTAPLDRAHRTAAACLAALVPFVLACLFQAVLLGLCLAFGVDLGDTPTVWEMAAGPLCVLGAALLGTATARWAPWPGVPFAVMLVLVGFNYAVYSTSARFLGFFVEFVLWTSPMWTFEKAPGSAFWHAVYLLALSLGAAALAMLRDSARRGFWLGIGATLVLTAVLSAVWQLP